MGRGDLQPPADIAGRVIDLGFVPDEDRAAAYAGACVLVNPSKLESLGMVVLEAWLAGTPAHRQRRSPVLREHCRDLGRGALVRLAQEFVEALDLVAGDPGLRRRMADGGRPLHPRDLLLARGARSLPERPGGLVVSPVAPGDGVHQVAAGVAAARRDHPPPARGRGT